MDSEESRERQRNDNKMSVRSRCKKSPVEVSLSERQFRRNGYKSSRRLRSVYTGVNQLIIGRPVRSAAAPIDSSSPHHCTLTPTNRPFLRSRVKERPPPPPSPSSRTRYEGKRHRAFLVVRRHGTGKSVLPGPMIALESSYAKWISR